MTTSTLGIAQVAANQNQKEVTINEADQALEDLSNLTIDLTVTASFTMTDEQYRSGIRFRLGGTPAGAFNVRLPASERLFIVFNDSGQTATIGVDPAANGFDGTTVALADGEQRILICDGTDVEDVLSYVAGASDPANWNPNTQIGVSYTLQNTDRGRIVTFSNGSPITVTVEDEATEAFSPGDWVRIAQLSTGTVSVSGSGATINSFGATLSLAGQYAAAVLVYLGSDVWLLEGNLA